MNKVTTKRTPNPVDHDPEVLAFRAKFDEKSPLDEIIRIGAQQMLQATIEAEVGEFLLQHFGRQDPVWMETDWPNGLRTDNSAGCQSQKKCLRSVRSFAGTHLYKKPGYLLSHLWYYHRLEKLNYRVRYGDGCDLFDMVPEKP